MVGTKILYPPIAVCLLQHIGMDWWLAEVFFFVCPRCFPVVLIAYGFHTFCFRLCVVLLCALYLRVGCRSR